MRLDVTEDRKKINKILENCLPLMKINSKTTQDCADAILLYFIEKKNTAIASFTHVNNQQTKHEASSDGLIR